MRLTLWFLLGFIGFGWVFVLFCGGAKKGCELLRSIDEVHCNQMACNSFHTIIGVLVPWIQKFQIFSNILIKKSNM